MEVHEYEDEDDTVVTELSVAEDDRGKVIGRSGRFPPGAARHHEGGWDEGEGKRVLVEIVD